MKVAASIFSWIGGIITTIVGFVTLSRGQTVTYYSYYNGYSYTQQVPYDSWVWFLWIIFLILRLVILIWRQSSVSRGYKVGCGVCTLLFVSLIGGILTLCIPNDQLSENYVPASSYKPTITTPIPPIEVDSESRKPATLIDPLTEQEKADLILKYKKMCDEGIITQEEFEAKKKDLLK